ncbi:hypothetical protein H109_04331 [Trichophyton interdigitale MR816]|uniref:Uncharacterized protein n=1 Tax=Trichophyton interdigitale (strain MR816) TaxID=1215338 RepID=A0A059J7K4_TRIIM|nr:hypothetical protein H101_02596 [Trichophyton interdigitale H6]KDB23769.1 hypothetical protein H109_04331 [Trichophyton interdigitale MR816]
MARPASSVYSRELQHLRLPPFALASNSNSNTNASTVNTTVNTTSNTAGINDSTVTSISGLLRNTAESGSDRQTLPVKPVTISIKNKEKKNKKTADLLNALIAVLTLALVVLLVLSCVVALGGFNRRPSSSSSSSSPTDRPTASSTASSGIKISPGVPDEPSSTDTSMPTSLPTATATATGTSTATSTQQEREKLSALIPFLTFATGKTLTLDPDAAQTAI